MSQKILFISHDSSLQGAERCLLEAVLRLDKERFEALVLLPWSGPIDALLKEANIPYIIRYVASWIPSKRQTSFLYPFTWFRNLRARLWSLQHLIGAHNIDLVYTNTSTVLDGALAAHRAGIPHIWHIHEHLKGNTDLYTYLPYWLTDRLTLKYSNLVITPSKALATMRFPAANNKVRIIPNGIDLSTFQHGNGERLRTSLGIPANAPVLSFIGAISAVKDPLTFATAAASIFVYQPNTHFLLAGSSNDPALEQALQALIKRHGLSHCFHILGFRSDTHDILAAATVHVSTSLRESFGLTVIEAMAAGKAVVATRCGGPEDVLVDGETGFIVAPGRPDELANAVLKLLDDPELANAMGEAGHIRCNKLYSAEVYANSIQSTIEEVLCEQP